MAGPFFGGQFFGGGFFAPLPSAGGTIVSFLAGRGLDRAEVERIRLERALQKKKRELKRVTKQVKAAETRIQVAEPPKGILANLHLLEVKQQAIQNEMAGIYIDLQGVKDLINSMSDQSFDDDDEEEFLDGLNKGYW